MVGYHTSLGLAVGAALLAVVVGGAWGALAALMAGGDERGGTLADVIVAPGVGDRHAAAAAGRRAAPGA